MKVTNERLHQLCIKYNWFDEGTNSQYEKLFEANREGANIEQLAIIIWICSGMSITNYPKIVEILKNETIK